MDYYDVNDPACANYKVEFNGTLREDALLASSSGGWVKVEIARAVGWGMIQKSQKTLYGRVFVVRYEGFDDEEDLPVPEMEEVEPTYD